MCESKNFIPWVFLKFVSKRPKVFLSKIYAKLQNFIQLPLNLTKLCLIKRSHPVRCHFYNVSSMNFYRFTINNGLKHTIYYSLWNSKQSSVKMFLYKVDIVCSKCPPPAEAHASLISVCWSLSPASHPRSAAVHFFSLGNILGSTGYQQ